jgi:hypothetical protein
VISGSETDLIEKVEGTQLRNAVLWGSGNNKREKEIGGTTDA